MMTEVVDDDNDGDDDNGGGCLDPGLSKCLVHLPRKWNSENLRNFISEQASGVFGWFSGFIPCWTEVNFVLFFFPILSNCLFSCWENVEMYKLIMLGEGVYGGELEVPIGINLDWLELHFLDFGIITYGDHPKPGLCSIPLPTWYGKL
jgi:hypothetical protein